MILQQVLLKKVVVMGACLLACLQVASCTTRDKDVNLEGLYAYWHSRMASMEKQVQICGSFISKADSMSGEMPFDASSYVKRGKEAISEITTGFSSLSNNMEEVKKLVESLYELNIYIKKKQPASDNVIDIPFNGDIMKAATKSKIDGFLSKMLNDSTLMIENVHKFNLNMLNFVEKYSLKKYQNSQLEDLLLFKLARKNKMFATNIIFAFFAAESTESAFDADFDEQRLEHIISCLNNHISSKEISKYISAVQDDIRENKTSPLVSANAHFQSMFGEYGVGTSAKDSIMHIYFNLSKNSLSNEEISQCESITPEQVIRLVMIEYLMDGHLLNCKRNSLFSNLGKMISNMEEKEQNKILDVLSMLWDDWYCELRESVGLFFTQFCKEHSLCFNFFMNLKSCFTHSRWMYAVDMSRVELENPFSKGELAKEMHFDMSYVHPMWYMCKRYESVSHLDKPDPEFSNKPFMEREHRSITIRMHRISKNDDELIRAENMRDFMNICFLPLAVRVELLYRQQDASKCYPIASCFLKSLGMSLKRNKITSSQEAQEEAGSAHEQ
ncbi:hypothetical protein NEMIN01_0496 [Nematocida minor]|uniref:uncharacterized protein n=1 Tax=Nematocida minor TaxID=1912983 RepID=UPI00221E41FE|nr:uncharacterized protein NEMIN01_0496 [Nematocida minor]KAI5189433.1 hypothetical protein NEMIN01_0496 [Nematocida minor]